MSPISSPTRQARRPFQLQTRKELLRYTSGALFGLSRDHDNDDVSGETESKEMEGIKFSALFVPSYSPVGSHLKRLAIRERGTVGDMEMFITLTFPQWFSTFCQRDPKPTVVFNRRFMKKIKGKR